MRAVARDIADERVRADLNGSGRGKGVIFGEVRYRYLVRWAIFLYEERGGRAKVGARRRDWRDRGSEGRGSEGGVRERGGSARREREVGRRWDVD